MPSSPSECIVILSIETAVKKRWPSLTTQHGHGDEGVQVILVRDARIDDTLILEFDQYKMVTGREVVAALVLDDTLVSWWTNHGQSPDGLNS